MVVFISGDTQIGCVAKLRVRTIYIAIAIVIVRENTIIKENV